jgi:hypothetical protein
MSSHDGLAIDHARAHWERGYSIDGEREAVGKVMAIPAHQADGAACRMRQNAEAVMLDFVNPARSGRRLFRRARQARFKAG